jgi:hypothetical protein
MGFGFAGVIAFGAHGIAWLFVDSGRHQKTAD